jgi:S1-C subfamily serine protease
LDKYRAQFWVLFVVVMMAFSSMLSANTEVIANVKRSVVGIGVVNPLGTPKNVYVGTGFVFSDGFHVATNFHVVDRVLEGKEEWVVFRLTDTGREAFRASIIVTDAEHDLAILKVTKPLPAAVLSTVEFLPDGTDIAITGFPAAAALGFYPITHKGSVAAVVPIAIPSIHSSLLDASSLRRLRDPFRIYQLDITAYPGNSGSAVYELDTGKIIAIVNRVYVKKHKEAALSDPSGISYAIPIKYLIALARDNKINL